MKRFAGAMAMLVAMSALTACTPTGPDPDAERAAQTYADELQGWSAELTAAVPLASTWTQAQIDAKPEGEELPEELGVGEVLDEAPQLEEFDASVAERTPAYRRAVAVAEQVDGVLGELRSLEPESVKQLRKAGTAAFFIGSDLYYDTYGGPALTRVNAFSDALDAGIISPEGIKLQRDAEIAFARDRMKLLDTAVKAMQSTRKGADYPVIPDSAIGRSVGAFIVDWYEEDRAFEKRALAEVETWKQLSTEYGEFWGAEQYGSAFRVAIEHAAELRPAHAETVAALAEDLRSDREPTAFAGDPYRALLLQGYLPWGDPGQGVEQTVNRLWMLWRIRELEHTPDTAYEAARAALLEEINRGIAEDTVRDHRAGGTRALNAFSAITEAAERAPGDDEDEHYERFFERLAEAISFAEALQKGPMMAEVRSGYDAMIEETEKSRDDLRAIVENPDREEPDILAQYEVSVAVGDFHEGLEERLTEALTPSLAMLDDDAAFSERLAELIEATDPGPGSSEDRTPDA